MNFLRDHFFEKLKFHSSNIGDKEALASDEFNLNYRELWKLLFSISKQFEQLHLSTEDVVVLILPQGIQMGLTALALSRKCIVFPINNASTINEIAEYFNQSGAKYIITNKEIKGKLISSQEFSDDKIYSIVIQKELFYINDQSIEIRNEETNESLLIEDDQIAFLLLTSGSTSKPKMVPLTHRQLTYACLNLESSLAISKSDRFLNMLEQPLKLKRTLLKHSVLILLTAFKKRSNEIGLSR